MCIVFMFELLHTFQPWIIKTVKMYCALCWAGNVVKQRVGMLDDVELLEVFNRDSFQRDTRVLQRIGNSF